MSKATWFNITAIIELQRIFYMVKKETIAEGKTVEAAVSAGAAKLNATTDRVTYEIIETPKRGFLGFGETPAKVRVIYQIGPEDEALDFVRTLINNMGIDATAEISRSLSSSGDRMINISGEGAGVLIGHHGDTLDSLQFLVNLAVNRGGEDENREGYTRIVVDIENYREKREDTLRQLARSMANRVKKYKKNITLEPMNPYERRIIHSEVQNITNVSTVSIGQDSSRRVVIFYTENGQPTASQVAQAASAQADKDKTARRSRSDNSSSTRSRSGKNRRDKKKSPKAAAGLSSDNQNENTISENEAISEDADRAEALAVLNAQKSRRRNKKTVISDLAVPDSSESEAAVSAGNSRNDYSRDSSRGERRERGDRRDGGRRSDRQSDRRDGSSGSGTRPSKKNKTEDLIAKTIASFKSEITEENTVEEKPEIKTQAVVDNAPIILNANASSDDFKKK